MTIYEQIFLALDIFLFAVIIHLIRVSASAEITIKVNDGWVVPAFFAVIAVIIFFRFDGLFRIIEIPCVLLMGLLYFKVGYGLNKEGIIIAGRLIKYEDAGELTLDKEKNCLTYLRGMSPAALTFSADQYEKIETYLKSLNKLK